MDSNKARLLPIEGYLSEEGRKKVDELLAAGADPDLAIACAECELPEAQLYELPPKTEKSDIPWTKD